MRCLRFTVVYSAEAGCFFSTANNRLFGCSEVLQELVVFHCRARFSWCNFLKLLQLSDSLNFPHGRELRKVKTKMSKDGEAQEKKGPE